METGGMRRELTEKLRFDIGDRLTRSRVLNGLSLSLGALLLSRVVAMKSQHLSPGLAVGRSLQHTEATSRSDRRGS